VRLKQKSDQTPVEGPLGHKAGGQQVGGREVRGERFALSGGGARRVEHVQRHVQQVGQQVHVGLWAAAAGVLVERPLQAELEQQQLQVVHCASVGNVSVARALLKNHQSRQ